MTICVIIATLLGMVTTEAQASPVVTASLVEARDGGMTPALGSFGPLGAYGPLGTLGPVGSDSWNPSAWLGVAGDWSSWSRTIQGPLSESGPLGPRGPLSEIAGQLTPPAFRAGGVWAVLGAIGPLGALGPLGPLGPVGAHGFATDADGNYRHGTDVQRSVNIKYGEGRRTYGLFERYTEAFAKRMPDNNTSFMVEGQIDGQERDEFPFVSRADQWVTVLVVPEKQLDDFDLVIKSSDGSVIASSTSRVYIDFISLPVRAGTRLIAEVSLASSAQWLDKTYRLVVVGTSN